MCSLALAACADPAPSPGPRSGSGSDGLIEGDVFVLEDREHGPELCLGVVQESLPLRCGGVPVRGWDWDLVPGEESRSGVSWGGFHVTGTYDGASFIVSEVTASRAGVPDDHEIGTPCPIPDAGWTAPDVSRADEDDLLTAGHAAEAEPDSGGIWIDYLEEPVGDETPVPPGGIILNAAFTGDLERHTVELVPALTRRVNATGRPAARRRTVRRTRS